jgi:hypothetical protein
MAILTEKGAFMKRIAFALALLVPALAVAQPKGAVAADVVEVVVTVTKVDPKARTVTVRGPRGNLQTLAVPPEAQNLDRIKPGDRFKLSYAEAFVIALTRGGKPGVTTDRMIQVAPKGAKPGGYEVRAHSISGVIDAIDYKNRYVAVRGPKGNTVAFPVSAEVKDFDKLSVGDKITVAYSEAIAVEMVPVEKKP